MKGKDTEVVSTTSSTSKGSEKRKSSARFSLRRIFYPHSRRSKSQASLDLDTRSESSITNTNLIDKDGNTVRSSSSSSDSLPVAQFPVANHHTSLQQQTQPVAQQELQTDHLTQGQQVQGQQAQTMTERECPLCLSEYGEEFYPDISTCFHRSCIECLKQYLRIEIMESRVNICCPECAERFHPNDIKMILNDSMLIQKYEDFMVRRVLVSNPDARWCPAPNCG